MSTESSVIIQQIVYRGIVSYQLVWTEGGTKHERQFPSEAEAVVEMATLEERLRIEAMAGQGLTVNPFGELKPFINSKEVHYASLKLRPRGLKFKETIDDYIAAHASLKGLNQSVSDAAKNYAAAALELAPYDTSVDQVVFEWIELKKQIGDVPLFEILRAYLATKKAPLPETEAAVEPPADAKPKTETSPNET